MFALAAGALLAASAGTEVTAVSAAAALDTRSLSPTAAAQEQALDTRSFTVDWSEASKLNTRPVITTVLLLR